MMNEENVKTWLGIGLFISVVVAIFFGGVAYVNRMEVIRYESDVHDTPPALAVWVTEANFRHNELLFCYTDLEKAKDQLESRFGDCSKGWAERWQTCEEEKVECGGEWEGLWEESKDRIQRWEQCSADLYCWTCISQTAGGLGIGDVEFCYKNSR